MSKDWDDLRRECQEVFAAALKLRPKGYCHAKEGNIPGCQRLQNCPAGFDSTIAHNLLDDVYTRISAVVDHEYNSGAPQSASLLKWRQATEHKDGNGPEVTLERSIVTHGNSSWANQIPVASGLGGSAWGKKSCIDLAKRIEPGVYDLIELKAQEDQSSGCPLDAVIGILLYALCYTFIRETWGDIKKVKKHDLCGATEINLKVLGRREYFNGYDLLWFRDALNPALLDFGDRRIGIEMSLDFESYQCPLVGIRSEQDLKVFESSIKPVW